MTPTPKTTSRGKGSRARVMFADPSMSVFEKHQISRIVGGNWTFTNLPLAVLPCATLKQARELVRVGRFFQITEEEQAEVLAAALHGAHFAKTGYMNKQSAEISQAQARAVLSAIKGAKT